MKAAPHVEEPFFLQLFDLSPMPAVVTRLRDHTVLAVNRRTSEIFGVSQEDAVGLRTIDYYVDPAERHELVERIRRDGRADDVRLQLRRPNGETFWALASARLVTAGGEAAAFTVFSDISEQLAAEAALKSSEQRLTIQSQALTELMARYVGPSDRFEERLRDILVVSARTLQVARLSMWTLEDGHNTIRCVDLYHRDADAHESGALLHRDQAPAYFEALERERVICAVDALSDPRTREFAESYLVPNGIGAMLDVRLRQNSATVGVLCAEHVGGSRTWTIDEQNFAIATANLIVVAVADEERRRALARLAESEARARLVVDTAHDAFVGVDSAGRIVSWNAQAEKAFGWTRAEALGLNLVDTIIPPAFREAHARGMQRFHQTGDAPVVNKRLELTALHRDGREFPIEITITSPMRGEDGFFFGAFLRDISDRRERDDQLRRAKESAEAATKAKSEFLANMSHELRTPLNGVLGYAQLLQRDAGLSPNQREALEAIKKGGSHLLDLINDVLDLSKIEAGRVDIEAVATNLSQLAIDLKYLVADAAHRKGLPLTIAIAPDLPRAVVLDGRHLRQVLLNLLGNAIKFTDRGEVRLAIARSAEGQLVFEVSDTGVGIEPGELTAIFDAFTQTRTGAAAGGTGLGLTISQHLVATMGGELKVESVRGRGSRFFFALPLVPAPPTSALSSSGDEASATPRFDARLAEGQAVTALVVDDSTVNRRILAALLESAGVRVIPACGGFEAVALARKHRPDVVFMDLKMADLDGLEATRRLAADPDTAAIPVIAVTASAFENTPKAAREAGCVDYLPKPVRAESLFAALQTHVGVRFETGTPAEASLEPGLPPTIRRPGLSNRLREAISLGDVTDLERLAQDLAAGEIGEATLGRRIAQLTAGFDFDGLRALANSLAYETEAGHERS
jgi:PAS domain S-box-containing protein